ncbi:uncharacterized protein LOC117641600 [Thrips palmi]|uniref:Uncharacterized protein LOC117641600 n=1 Tax=Thrips palmi TaxID=161013 RepID=A0A6P8ZJ94_THRPL|nr:uncharacterized protein LOC117641600 [Thrips palmi]
MAVSRGGRLLLPVFFSLMAYSAIGTGAAAESAVKVVPERQRLAERLADSEQLQVDSLLDNLLLTVQRQMTKGRVDVETLPDVSLNSGRLTLTGTQGIIKGLTSLYRSDSAFMEYGNGSVILSTAFSLRTLEISYMVNAKYLFLSLNNDVSASVTYNSIKLRAGIFYNGDVCYLGLQEVSVDVLQGIQWRTSGFGSINALVSATINRLVPAATLKANLNNALQTAMSGFKAQCQDFIPGVNRGLSWKC